MVEYSLMKGCQSNLAYRECESCQSSYKPNHEKQAYCSSKCASKVRLERMIRKRIKQMLVVARSKYGHRVEFVWIDGKKVKVDEL